MFRLGPIFFFPFSIFSPSVSSAPKVPPPLSSLLATLTETLARKSCVCHFYVLGVLQVLYLPLLHKTGGRGMATFQICNSELDPYARSLTRPLPELRLVSPCRRSLTNSPSRKPLRAVTYEKQGVGGAFPFGISNFKSQIRERAREERLNSTRVPLPLFLTHSADSLTVEALP
jgi:hypothetical protein